jgi:hypothetical protein
MIANLGPGLLSYDETLSTLLYADRAKQIKNAPRINEDAKDALLRQYQEEINRLKAELEKRRGGGAPGGPQVIVNADGTTSIVEGSALDANGDPIVQEKVIEKVVVKDTGIKEEDLKAIREKAAAEVSQLQNKSEEEKAAIVAEKVAAEEKAKLHEQEMRVKQQILEKERKQLDDLQKKLAEKYALPPHSSAAHAPSPDTDCHTD